MREQAEREAQLILREARAEAERIVAGAANDARQVQGELEALVRQRRSYLSQLRTMVERQLSDIEAAEASAASMTPVRREAAPAAPAAATEQPEWLDSVVKE